MKPDLLIFLVYTFASISSVASDCYPHFCNGHGTCVNATSTCNCYEGWGASTDITNYRAPDCSKRTCPSSKAWADLPSSSTQAHATMECSNRGSCDRDLGVCNCMDGFEGIACERMSCPNDCSGHGQCLSMQQLARLSNALPLGPNTLYEGDEDSTTWDEQKIYGCLCDSSWTVGLGSGETQEPEWFGPDCSLRHCPSGDNPKTSTDETNCTNVKAKDSNYKGELGNLCQVDCANQGRCDYATGTCQCFNGMFGANCTIIDTNAVYSNINGEITYKPIT